MATLEVRAKLLRWGNSFGLRVSRRDVERLGLQPGAEIGFRLDLPGSTLRIHDLPSLHLGGAAADDHDDLFARSADSP